MKKKLKEICNIEKGKQIDTKSLDDSNSYRYINGGIKESGFYNDFNTSGEAVLISEGGASCGYVNYVNERFWCGCHCYRLTDIKVYPKFLFYSLKASQNGIMELRTGAAMPNIKKESLKNFEVSIIEDKEEQIKIAAHLDKIQSAIDNKKQQLSLLDEAVKSKFVEMFGENPVESGKWKVENLGDVAEIKIGPFGSLLHKQDYIENGHCLVNPSHIKDGKIQVDYSLSVTDEKYNELKAYQLEINDIVLGRRGEMGRCAIVTDNTLLCGTGSMIVRPNGKLKSFFLNFVLSSNVTKKYLEDNAIGVTMKNINEPLVKSISVPVIPLSLQNQFAAFIQQIDKAKSIAKQQLADLQELLDSKMQEYFG